MYSVSGEHTLALMAGLAVPALALAGPRLARLASRFAPVQRAAAVYLAASSTTRAAAALMLASAVMHLVLIPGHSGEPFTAFLFALDALGFIAVSILAFTVTWWRRPAALLLSATLIGYVVWVIAGWEAADQGGMTCKLAELIALGLVMAPQGERPRRRLRRIWQASALPLMTIVTGLGIWAGSLAHPDKLHVHPGATLQVVSDIITPQEKIATATLLAQVGQSLARYQNPQAAIAAGFQPEWSSDPKALLHWTNPANERRVLDPWHPQTLVFVQTHHGTRLVGAMFQMQKMDQWGPDPGGALTQWHQHEGICFGAGPTFTLETPFWNCPLGTLSVTAPPMLHVWIVKNPSGPFSADLDTAVVQGLIQ